MSRSTTKSPTAREGPAAELSAALASCRGAFFATGLLSGMSNVLMLTGAIFMLEVYDRVLPSRSMPTLIGLAILAAGLYRRARAARPDPRAHPHPHRHQPRRGAERTNLPDHRAPAVDRRAAQRRHRADARPRHRALVSLQRRSGGAFRPALDAGLSRRLLRLPFLDRHDRGGRSGDSDHAHPPDRMALAQADKATAKLAQSRNAMIEIEPAQFRGSGHHGHGSASHRALEQGQPGIILPATGVRATRRGLWRNLESTAADAAIRRARGRRLSCHLSSKRRPESSSRARSSARARWRRSILRLPIGEAGWRRGKVGTRLRALLATIPPDSEPMPLQAPQTSLVVENANVLPPGKRKPAVRDLSLKLQTRKRPRGNRAERFWQVVARANAGRILGACQRQGLPRRRVTGSMGSGYSRAPYRLSAPARRTPQRQRRAKHQPVRARCGSARRYWRRRRPPAPMR